MSKPIPIKYNARNTQKLVYPTRKNLGAQRTKITPSYRVNHSFPSSTQINIPSIQAVDSNEEKIHDDEGFEIKPTIKKTCARCKESNRCVKLLYSKINRIEELVKGIAKSTDNQQSQQPQQPPSPIPQIFLTQPSQLLTPAPSPIQTFSNTSFNNFSNHSLEDLQNIVSIITNTMISNKGGCVPVVRPNALHMFN
ncbi:18412_t:CDS:2 [Rhizophagus irregularis]|nr:18412_t:CDS:2 [Rhizophagus irregularis]